MIHRLLSGRAYMKINCMTTLTSNILAHMYPSRARLARRSSWHGVLHESFRNGGIWKRYINPLPPPFSLPSSSTTLEHRFTNNTTSSRHGCSGPPFSNTKRHCYMSWGSPIFSKKRVRAVKCLPRPPSLEKYHSLHALLCPLLSSLHKGGRGTRMCARSCLLQKKKKKKRCKRMLATAGFLLKKSWKKTDVSETLKSF
jgi:hypothetical protein